MSSPSAAMTEGPALRRSVPSRTPDYHGKPEMVETYFRGLAREGRERLAGMGARSIEEIVGWVERLRPRTAEAARALADLLQPTPTPPQTGCLVDDDTLLHVELNKTISD